MTEATIKATAIDIRLIPPMVTMLSPATTSSTGCEEPRRARMIPITSAMIKAVPTKARLPPL
jgi:hypothetical protein